MNVYDAAKVLQCSTAKISRLENGKGIPYERDVRDLIAAYGEAAAQDATYLYELASDARAQDWFDGFQDVLRGEMNADHLNRYYELERAATSIMSFQADLVPGLLQTEAYIDAVCALVFPDKPLAERKRFIEFRRMRRDRILLQATPPAVSYVLSEAAVLGQIGGVAVLRDQLASLAADLRGPLSYLDLRIVPLARAARGSLGGPFLILKYPDERDQDVVYLEGREGARYLETDADVARYEAMYEGLLRDSLSREESLARLDHEAERLAHTEG
jgi:Domain of unknown function (DUF5753)